MVYRIFFMGVIVFCCFISFAEEREDAIELRRPLSVRSDSSSDSSTSSTSSGSWGSSDSERSLRSAASTDDEERSCIPNPYLGSLGTIACLGACLPLSAVTQWLFIGVGGFFCLLSGTRETRIDPSPESPEEARRREESRRRELEAFLTAP